MRPGINTGIGSVGGGGTGGGVTVCTSTTRPASPAEGLHIYETDTDRTLKNVGTPAAPDWRVLDVDIHDHDTRYFTETESDARFKPIGYVPGWTEITGKPATFAPDTHNHSGADITSGTVAAARLPASSEGASGISQLATPAETTTGTSTTKTVHPAGVKAVADTKIPQAIRVVTTDTTATAQDRYLLVDASAGNRTVTLPSPVGIAGREYCIKKDDDDTSSNTVTVVGPIEGAASIYTDTPGEAVWVISEGSEWIYRDPQPGGGLSQSTADGRYQTVVNVAGYASPQAAVNAAQAAAPAIVFFPDDTFTTSAPIDVNTSGITLDLGRAKIVTAHSGAAIRFIGSAGTPLTNVSIRNGTIDLNNAGASGVTFTYCTAPDAFSVQVLNGLTTSGAGVSFSNCTRPNSRAINTDSVGVGVTLDASTGGSVTGCISRSNKRDGVLAYNGAHNASVVACTVDGYNLANENGRAGIHIYGSDHCSVVGNSVKSHATSGTDDSPKIRFRDGLDFSCTGNVCSGAMGGGIAVVALSDIGSGAGKGVVTGNTIRDVAGNGIQVALGAGGNANSLFPVTITGNTILGVRQVGTIAGQGISLAAGTDLVTVSGNLMDDLDGEGISTSVPYAAVVGNTIHACGKGTLGSKVAIYVVAGIATVIGNQCVDTQATKTMAHGLRVLSGATARVGANYYEGMTGAAVNNAGTVSAQVGDISTALVGFYGKAPIARPAAIASPTADAASLKTAVDAIRTALTNLGLTA